MPLRLSSARPGLQQHAGQAAGARAPRTDGGGRERVRLVAAVLERAEQVGGGVQRAAPQQAQAREVHRQQHQLAAQRRALPPWRPHAVTSRARVTRFELKARSLHACTVGAQDPTGAEGP
jgi:hypothetical protein